MTPAGATSDERVRGAARVAQELAITRTLQPDEVTCGPTCLSGVYHYYGDDFKVDQVIDALERLEDGGTLAVFLGISALKRGYEACLYSYDLRIFDPTWFDLPRDELKQKILERFPHLRDEKRQRAARAYIEFLDLGGNLEFEELTPALMKDIIDRGHPILAGLSATYLYRFPRERWDAATKQHVDDDVKGEPTGHFVIISGYDHWGRRLSVVDPSEHAPSSASGRISVDSDRLINAILLGDATYDAVLLEVWPS